MSAITEIRRHKARGDQPRFVQHKGGFVMVTRRPHDILDLHDGSAKESSQ